MTANRKERTNDPKLHSLELQLADAEAERARLKGLVDSLRVDRERLRQRVLEAARGHVCGRCAEQLRPKAGAPQPPPPAPVSRFDPNCAACRGRVCDGLGQTPCAAHGGPVAARL